MAQGELGRRQRPRRSAGDGEPVDAEMVEQLDQHVGLMGRRGIVGKGAAR